jgi:hypothetical protein
MPPTGSQYPDTYIPSLLPFDMFALVNERLLNPIPQEKPGSLHNYFLGIREYMEAPPSPTYSDPECLPPYMIEDRAVLKKTQSSQSSTPASHAPIAIPSPDLTDSDPSSSDDDNPATLPRHNQTFARPLKRTTTASGFSKSFKYPVGRRARKGATRPQQSCLLC